MVIDNHGYKQYSRDEMLQLVKKWYQTHGKIVIRDLRHKNNTPTVSQVINEFGSFQQCLNEAEISIDEKSQLFNRKHLSDEELLDDYRKFVKEHLKTNMFLPTNNEVNSCNYIQSASVYEKRFGNFKNVNKMIGYDQDEFNKNALEKDNSKVQTSL